MQSTQKLQKVLFAFFLFLLQQSPLCGCSFIICVLATLIFIRIAGGWLKPDTSIKIMSNNESGFIMLKANYSVGNNEEIWLIKLIERVVDD